jgi:tungstate transport system substrate-binding protein
MARSLRSLIFPLLMGAVCTTAASGQVTDRGQVVLATTTSVRDAGLLDVLLPPFEERTGIRVKVIAVGSGQAMELGRRGEADILIVHDPVGEQSFMATGFGVERRPLMRNSFVLVGPQADPAGARGHSAVDAMRAIAHSGALFVSRADRSGTNVKESRLWALAGVVPGRASYRESGQGMSATLQIASELQAYTLTDIGTFLSHKSPLGLAVLVEGDSMLVNPYHILLPNPGRVPWINAEGGRLLADYLLEPVTQNAIDSFGRAEFGRSLFEEIRSQETETLRFPMSARRALGPDASSLTSDF